MVHWSRIRESVAQEPHWEERLKQSLALCFGVLAVSLGFWLILLFNGVSMPFWVIPVVMLSASLAMYLLGKLSIFRS